MEMYKTKTCKNNPPPSKVGFTLLGVEEPLVMKQQFKNK
jgi:hypothetical protein